MRHLRLVALTGSLLGLSLCADPGSPTVAGQLFFTATVDGTTWAPDTTQCIVGISPRGTISIIAASRLVTAQEEEGITILFAGFPTPGEIPLLGSLSNGIATFAVYPMNGGVRGIPVLYNSSSGLPGLLSITDVSTADNLITGTFTFEGVAIPDMIPHRVVTAQFRLRYEVAQVP